MDRPKNRLLTALTVSAVLLAAAALYTGSYLAVVIPQRVIYRAAQVVDNQVVESASAQVHPRYSIGGVVAEWLFWPAHQLDRQIRRETWE